MESEEKMHQSELTIAKYSLNVELLLADDDRFGASVYLAEQSARLTGPQSLDELLNESRFVPCVTADSFILVGCSSLLWISADCEEYRSILGSRVSVLSSRMRQPVEVKLAGNYTLNGRVMLDDPSQRPRLSDCFNRLDRFFSLDCGERLFFVNSAHVITLRETGPLEEDDSLASIAEDSQLDIETGIVGADREGDRSEKAVVEEEED